MASLPYSNLFFTEAFENETQNSWISGIVDALEYFGAVPKVLMMDNAKTLVKRTDWREGEIQPAIKSFVQLLQHATLGLQTSYPGTEESC